MTITAQARVAFLSSVQHAYGDGPLPEDYRERMVERLLQEDIAETLKEALMVIMGSAFIGVDLVKLLDDLFLSVQLRPQDDPATMVRTVLNGHLTKQLQ